MSQEPNKLHRIYLYTNWRGKTFVFDDKFVDEMKKTLTEDGELNSEDVDWMTPESMMRDIPIYEEIERLAQLEQMWEQSAG